MSASKISHSRRETDDGFFEWDSSDEENYAGVVWPPPGRRRRHPAGSGIIYVPPFNTQISASALKTLVDSQKPAELRRAVSGAQINRSEPVDIPRKVTIVPNSPNNSSGFSSAVSNPSPFVNEPLSAFILRRFLECQLEEQAERDNEYR